MIDNTLDQARRTRGRPRRTRGQTSNLRPTGEVSNLDTHDGRVSSGVGVHLTPTKKKERIKDKIQTLCSKIGAQTVRSLKGSSPRMFAQCVEMMRAKRRT